MITLSIDITKLDKSKFVTGKKGTYCNLVLIETPHSEWGEYMVKQDCTKEERESGVQMPILGNGKVLTRRAPAGEAPKRPPAPREYRTRDEDDDEIPF